MRFKVDTMIAIVLVSCALVTTALVVRRELAPPRIAAAQVDQAPVRIEDWRSHLGKGTRLGSAAAPVQLIEFADYECPFCSDFHATIETIRKRYPTQVAITYFHLPLPMHRFAETAARVIECAGKQGRFEAMQSILFERQRDFGLKPWSEFAIEAGVRDLAAFGICIEDETTIPEVTQGRALAAQLDIQSTPTLIVNGWKLIRPPTLKELGAMIERILAGKSPVS